MLLVAALKPMMLGLEIVEAWRHGRERVIARSCGVGCAHGIGANVGECDGGGRHTGAAGIGYTAGDFTERLTESRNGAQSHQRDKR